MRVRTLIARAMGLKSPRERLLGQLPKNAVGAEIGVWKGDFSAALLGALNPKELYLIDPWTFQAEFPERMFGGSVAKSQADMDEIHDSVMTRFRDCLNVRIRRGYSRDVIKEFPEAFFDFVYIDGNHYYEFVLEDLRSCYSRIRSGGVLCGDDFDWGETDGFPVRRAVLDFLEERQIPRKRFRVFRSQYMITVS